MLSLGILLLVRLMGIAALSRLLAATHSDLVVGVVVACLAFVVATVLYQGWVFIDLERLRQGLDVRFPSQ